jgi:orotate phosphoribosyltransferase
MKEYASQIARAALEIEAIKLRPDDPFTWASGYRMPIYNDNRLLLGFPAHRSLIAAAFEALVIEKGFQADFIAGIPTAGIPHGVLLADRLNLPFIYGKKTAKDHGMERRVEGISSENQLKGKKILLVEDLISTGKSSAQSATLYQAIGSEVIACISIFTYGFSKAVDCFSEIGVSAFSLLDFPTLIGFVKKERYFSDEQSDILAEWQNDPFSWGEKHGFPKVEK